MFININGCGRCAREFTKLNNHSSGLICGGARLRFSATSRLSYNLVRWACRSIIISMMMADLVKLHDPANNNGICLINWRPFPFQNWVNGRCAFNRIRSRTRVFRRVCNVFLGPGLRWSAWSRWYSRNHYQLSKMEQTRSREIHPTRGVRSQTHSPTDWQWRRALMRQQRKGPARTRRNLHATW